MNICTVKKPFPRNLTSGSIKKLIQGRCTMNVNCGKTLSQISALRVIRNTHTDMIPMNIKWKTSKMTLPVMDTLIRA